VNLKGLPGKWDLFAASASFLAASGRLVQRDKEFLPKDFARMKRGQFPGHVRPSLSFSPAALSNFKGLLEIVAIG
jgi:hypothetical protein